MEDIDLLNKINIIGKDSQIVHIILKKNDKINVNKSYITYASSENLEEIIYKNVDSLLNQTTNSSYLEASLKKIENESFVRLKNKQSNIEYVGLSRGGKIMKISPILYSNLYIKLDNILAFNNNIEILNDSEIDNKLNKLTQRPNYQFGFREMIDNYLFNKNEYGLVKSKLISGQQILKNPDTLSFLNLSSYYADFVYISGRNNLIEKRLGENESMIIMGNSLVAFEQTITFSHINKTDTNSKYVNNVNDIIVEGPGLVIFELCERKMPINHHMGLIIGISIALFILEIFAQLVLHYNLRPIAE